MRTLLFAVTGVATAVLLACNPDSEPTASPPEGRTRAAQSLGGTLAVRPDGAFAVAADPDVDRVWIADLRKDAIVGSVKLNGMDEPMRAIFGANGRAHVLLRGTGELATFSVPGGDALTRLHVCDEPRGLTFDGARNQLVVACASGELVYASPDGTQRLGQTQLPADLRDVSAKDGQLFVSRMRAAEVVKLSTGNAPRTTIALGKAETLPLSDGSTRKFEPSTVWRMQPMADGGFAFLQQRSTPEPIVLNDTSSTSGASSASPACGAYGGCGGNSSGLPRRALEECEAISQSVFMVQKPDGTVLERRVRGAAPVDFAVDEANGVAWVVKGDGSSADVIRLDSMLTAGEAKTCATSGLRVSGMPAPTAVALLPEGRGPLFQSKTALYTPDGRTIELPQMTRPDTSGRDLFVQPADGSGVACASCHPDGLDDGRVWNFSPIGPRRTPALTGGILSTAPFHWDGDMKDFNMLMQEVFIGRMGARPSLLHRGPDLANWLDALPAAKHTDASASLDSVKRGQVLFNDAAVGCASCHAGKQLTNNASVDVGTGGTFQVPRLVDLKERAPYMHDGCAKTLKDRFDPVCGGAMHGNVSGLTPGQIDDLVSYLETL